MNELKTQPGSGLENGETEVSLFTPIKITPKTHIGDIASNIMYRMFQPDESDRIDKVVETLIPALKELAAQRALTTLDAYRLWISISYHLAFADYDNCRDNAVAIFRRLADENIFSQADIESALSYSKPPEQRKTLVQRGLSLFIGKEVKESLHINELAHVASEFIHQKLPHVMPRFYHKCRQLNPEKRVYGYVHAVILSFLGSLEKFENIKLQIEMYKAMETIYCMLLDMLGEYKESSIELNTAIRNAGYNQESFATCVVKHLCYELAEMEYLPLAQLTKEVFQTGLITERLPRHRVIEKSRILEEIERGIIEPIILDRGGQDARIIKALQGTQDTDSGPAENLRNFFIETVDRYVKRRSINPEELDEVMKDISDGFLAKLRAHGLVPILGADYVNGLWKRTGWMIQNEPHFKYTPSRPAQKKHVSPKQDAPAQPSQAKKSSELTASASLVSSKPHTIQPPVKPLEKATPMYGHIIQVCGIGDLSQEDCQGYFRNQFGDFMSVQLTDLRTALIKNGIFNGVEIEGDYVEIFEKLLVDISNLIDGMVARITSEENGLSVQQMNKEMAELFADKSVVARCALVGSNRQTDIPALAYEVDPDTDRLFIQSLREFAHTFRSIGTGFLTESIDASQRIPASAIRLFLSIAVDFIEERDMFGDSDYYTDQEPFPVGAREKDFLNQVLKQSQEGKINLEDVEVQRKVLEFMNRHFWGNLPLRIEADFPELMHYAESGTFLPRKKKTPVLAKEQGKSETPAQPPAYTELKTPKPFPQPPVQAAPVLQEPVLEKEDIQIEVQAAEQKEPVSDSAESSELQTGSVEPEVASGHHETSKELSFSDALTLGLVEHKDLPVSSQIPDYAGEEPETTAEDILVPEEDELIPENDLDEYTQGYYEVGVNETSPIPSPRHTKVEPELSREPKTDTGESPSPQPKRKRSMPVEEEPIEIPLYGFMGEDLSCEYKKPPETPRIVSARTLLQELQVKAVSLQEIPETVRLNAQRYVHFVFEKMMPYIRHYARKQCLLSECADGFILMPQSQFLELEKSLFRLSHNVAQLLFQQGECSIDQLVSLAEESLAKLPMCRLTEEFYKKISDQGFFSTAGAAGIDSTDLPYAIQRAVLGREFCAEELNDIPLTDPESVHLEQLVKKLPYNKETGHKQFVLELRSTNVFLQWAKDCNTTYFMGLPVRTEYAIEEKVAALLPSIFPNKTGFEIPHALVLEKKRSPEFQDRIDVLIKRANTLIASRSTSTQYFKGIEALIDLLQNYTGSLFSAQEEFFVAALEYFLNNPNETFSIDFFKQIFLRSPNARKIEGVEKSPEMELLETFIIDLQAEIQSIRREVQQHATLELQLKSAIGTLRNAEKRRSRLKDKIELLKSGNPNLVFDEIVALKDAIEVIDQEMETTRLSIQSLLDEIHTTKTARDELRALEHKKNALLKGIFALLQQIKNRDFSKESSASSNNHKDSSVVTQAKEILKGKI